MPNHRFELSGEQEAYLKRHYASTPNEVLCDIIGTSTKTLMRLAKERGLTKARSYTLSQEDRAYILSHYPTERNAEIASRLNIRVGTVIAYARRFGITKKKSVEEETPTKMIGGIVYRLTENAFYVSKEGELYRHGKNRKAMFPMKGEKRLTAKVYYVEDRKQHYVSVAHLVAKAWVKGYTDYLVYKDGNIHNISASNLLPADKTKYYRYMQRNCEHTADDVKERIKKLERVAEESMLTRDFFVDGDFTKINSHVEKVLLPELGYYCEHTLHMGKETTERIVPEAVGRMYECIDNGMCLYNYERYLKKLLHNYKKDGDFGLTGKIPKKIELYNTNLNLECLWQKYKKT